ncbi:hypothetical protein FHR81_003285 [Actinoalloteichus hoggarensis]|uniref:Uncharacterized protein n=1 Tax=Actinoalloteichus hoggarensis TaxID=1470176 RepID=A0A221W6P7_9PSEU|nr:hypothetical protein AHOG_20110 [Actinoalloteichus hoggarensis]MBB5922233.1 hypothetical protein [Actinoalloteichus hoggarensis]
MPFATSLDYIHVQARIAMDLITLGGRGSRIRR